MDQSLLKHPYRTCTPVCAGAAGLEFAVRHVNNEYQWSHQLLISTVCCAAHVNKLSRSPASQHPVSPFPGSPRCGDRIFSRLTPLYTHPITVPHRAQDSLSPCRLRLVRRLPLQVHRHPGSNSSSIAHFKTTPNKRESTSLSTTSPISSNAALPPMRSLWYSETRRRSLKNIETEIAS